MVSVDALVPLPGRAEAPLPPHEGRQVDLGGLRLHVRRTPAGQDDDGTREPAVAVHGLGGSSLNWTDLAAVVARRLDVRALDLPGHGRSGPPVDGDYSLAAHAAAVKRLCEHVGAPVHLAGNSLGGAVALRVAANRPDLVRSLLLVSPAMPERPPVPRRLVDPRVVARLVPGLTSVVEGWASRRSARERVSQVLELCYADVDRVHPERRRQAEREADRRASLPWAESSFTGSLRGLVRAWARRGEDDLWRQAAALRVPVTVVWGRHDRLVRPALAEKFRGLLRDGHVEVWDDAAHVAQLEHPDRVAERWLDLVGRAARAGEERGDR